MVAIPSTNGTLAGVTRLEAPLPQELTSSQAAVNGWSEPVVPNAAVQNIVCMGGEPTFAARKTNDYSADKTDLAFVEFAPVFNLVGP